MDQRTEFPGRQEIADEIGQISTFNKEFLTCLLRLMLVLSFLVESLDKLSKMTILESKRLN